MSEADDASAECGQCGHGKYTHKATFGGRCRAFMHASATLCACEKFRAKGERSPPPAPPEDFVILPERQVRALERIAKALEKISEVTK